MFPWKSMGGMGSPYLYFDLLEAKLTNHVGILSIFKVYQPRVGNCKAHPTLPVCYPESVSKL